MANDLERLGEYLLTDGGEVYEGAVERTLLALDMVDDADPLRDSGGGNHGAV